MRSFVILLCFIGLCYSYVNLPMKHERLHASHPLYSHFAERRASGDFENFQMGGNIYPVGIYWVAVDIGTPAQSLLVAVDSGSSDLLVPSATCNGCHEQNTGSFDTTKSSTLSEISCNNNTVKCRFPCSGQCTFDNSYQTCNLTDPQQVCTVKGGLYSDIYAQGNFSASVVFGLIDSQTANFQQFFVIDGVIGMAFAAGSSWDGTPPFDRLVQEGECADVFSMCMKPNAGGVLTLGGIDPNLYTGSFVYTPLKKTFGEYILYVLDVTDIQVDSTTIGLPPNDYTKYGTLGGCVLDSGTNTILFPTQIYNAWKSVFNNYFSQACATGASVPPGVCDGSLLAGTCYQYTSAQRNAFPQIEFKLNDVSLSMDGPDYIVANSTATTGAYYCMGVLNTGNGGNFIIGDVLMQNYYVVFDKQNKRVGWAPVQASNCIGSNDPITY